MVRTTNKPRAIVAASLAVLLAAPSIGRGQEQTAPPEEERQPPASSISDVTPTPPPPSPTPASPATPATPATPGTPATPATPPAPTTPTTPTVIRFGSSPAPAVPPPGSPPRAIVSPDLAARWRHARNLSAAGTVFGLAGMALTLSSVIYVGVTGYPCNPNDPIAAANPNNPCNQNNMLYKNPQPTDTAPMLGYFGASTSALGFILSASGLGYQHHLLAKVDADPGRGIFAAGTTFGLLGFVAVGVSYFIGLTDTLSPRDQALAILGTSITSSFFSLLGSLLYTIDSSRTKRAWSRLPTSY